MSGMGAFVGSSGSGGSIGSGMDFGEEEVRSLLQVILLELGKVLEHPPIQEFLLLLEGLVILAP